MEKNDEKNKETKWIKNNIDIDERIIPDIIQTILDVVNFDNSVLSFFAATYLNVRPYILILIPRTAVGCLVTVGALIEVRVIRGRHCQNEVPRTLLNLKKQKQVNQLKSTKIINHILSIT